MIVKITGTELALGATANSVNSGKLVRITNPTGTHALVTVYVGANNLVNTAMTLLSNNSIILQKEPTDTLVSNNTSVVAGTIRRFS